MMKILFLLHASFLLFGLLYEAEALECNESQAPFKVSFHGPTAGTWMHIAASPTMGNSSVNYFEQKPADYENCIIRAGSCFYVQVGSHDAYTICWDGRIIPVGRNYGGTTGASFVDKTDIIGVTEVGEACVPVCDAASEALFEYKTYQSPFGEDPYRLEDKDGNMLLGYDKFLPDIFGFLSHRACLPKAAACYQLLVGSPSHYPNATITVSYNSDLLLDTNGYLFKSIRFGQSCTAICDPDTESLLELFMYRNLKWESFVSEAPSFQWELIRHKIIEESIASRRDATLLSNGTVSGNGTVYRQSDPTSISLTHEAICVPKNSCLSFILSAPHSPYDDPYVMLTLDNVIYKRGRWSLKGRSRLVETTNMGQCTLKSLCDHTSEALFEYMMDVQSPVREQDPRQPYFYLENKTRGWPDIDFNSRYFDGQFAKNSRHGVVQCVPSAKCVYQLQVPEHPGVKDYTVKRDGKVLSERTIVVREMGRPFITTEFGCTLDVSLASCAKVSLLGWLLLA